MPGKLFGVRWGWAYLDIRRSPYRAAAFAAIATKPGRIRWEHPSRASSKFKLTHYPGLQALDIQSTCRILLGLIQRGKVVFSAPREFDVKRIVGCQPMIAAEHLDHPKHLLQ
jgi:hypothetical protein